MKISHHYEAGLGGNRRLVIKLYEGGTYRLWVREKAYGQTLAFSTKGWGASWSDDVLMAFHSNQPQRLGACLHYCLGPKLFEYFGVQKWLEQFTGGHKLSIYEVKA